MICEVYIDMKNDNALYTISMLSVLLEKNKGDYSNLLIPFVLCSLPPCVGDTIDVEKITISMRGFGFVDFPHRYTEYLLKRLAGQEITGHIYVKKVSNKGKPTFYVSEIYNKTEFEANRNDLRKKIDEILVAIQKFFETRFYCKTLPTDQIRSMLISFFATNGLTVIRSIEDLRLISKATGSDSFHIAHFILEEYKKKSLIFDELCEVTKGFLTYKGLYYFLDEQKNHIDSKFQDVTFYLDCSLVLDALNYDTPSDYEAISDLIRLIRRSGGKVAVFRHTANEAANLVEAFARKPYARNCFRLDNLAVQKLPQDLLLAVAKDIPKKLKENLMLDTVDAPTFSDKTNYKNVLGEQEIVNWLKANRPNVNSESDSEEDRFIFDAKSIMAIGMCRRNNQPRYIEQAKAILVTQDLWINRCLKELYPDKFKAEVYYAISDSDLVSLLWLQDHKQTTTLPSDILIANAHAACRVAPEVMDRAIQIADTLVKSGDIPSDAALLVRSHFELKQVLAESVSNDVTKLSDETVCTTIHKYIRGQSQHEINQARLAEQVQAKTTIEFQAKMHSSEKNSLITQIHDRDHLLEEKDEIITKLTTDILKQKQTANEKEHRQILEKTEKIENIASSISQKLKKLITILFALAAITLFVIFAIQCYRNYIIGSSWLPYAIIEVLAFVGVPAIFLSPKSILNIFISRVCDSIYTKIYSYLISKL